MWGAGEVPAGEGREEPSNWCFSSQRPLGRRSVSCSVVYNSLRPHGPATRLCLWNSPGKNTGVVAISFSRDLPDPGFRLRSPALQADSLLSEPLGKLWDAVISNPLMTSGRAGQVDSLPLKDEGAENRGGENTEPHRCTSFLPFCLTSHITGCFLLLQRVSEC